MIGAIFSTLPFSCFWGGILCHAVVLDLLWYLFFSMRAILTSNDVSCPVRNRMRASYVYGRWALGLLHTFFMFLSVGA
jgi:hypothetical protein